MGMRTARGWSLKDWGKFVGAWKEAGAEKRRGEEQKASRYKGRSACCVSYNTGGAISNGSKDDAVVRSSTDKLSAVFDWLIETSAQSIHVDF